MTFSTILWIGFITLQVLGLTGLWRYAVDRERLEHDHHRLRELDLQAEQALADLDRACSSVLGDHPDIKVRDRRSGARHPGHFSSPEPYRELPKVSGRPGVGVTTAEAAEILCRNMQAAFGVPEPVVVPRPFELFDKCPKCPEVDMHLLGDRDTITVTTASGTVGPSIGRECRSCGHTWKERLDA